MTTASLVSICIPAYNAENTIAEALRSALNQSHRNIEVIVVDDGSTDRTVEIVKGFDDSRVSVHQHDSNRGASATWNHVLELARGDYVKLLCHDDVLYPDCIETQLGGFADRGVKMVASNRDIINGAGRKIASLKPFRRDERVDGKAFFRRCVRQGANLAGEPHAVLFDGALIRENRIRFGKDFYVIDIDFYAKVLAVGDIGLLSRPLSAFRVSRDSASFKMARQQTRLLREFMRQTRQAGVHRISTLDYFLFCLRCEIRNVLKMGFYFLHVRS